MHLISTARCDTTIKPWGIIIATHQFCTLGWLEESLRIYRANPTAKDKFKNLTVKICFRVKCDPSWGISEDIIFGALFDRGELKTLKFFTKDEAFHEAEYLMVATPRAWKRILRKKHEFFADLMLGKIKLEMGTQAKILDIAVYINNIFDFLTQVDLQFPDDMSKDELEAYRSKMETLQRERGP